MQVVKRFGLTLFGVVALTALVFAHGGDHVKGKVTTIGKDSITIETPAKEAKTVGFDDTTKFEKSGTAATVKDLKVGDRVVVDIHEMGDKLHATVVRFGAPQKEAPPTSHSH